MLYQACDLAGCPPGRFIDIVPLVLTKPPDIASFAVVRRPFPDAFRT